MMATGLLCLKWNNHNGAFLQLLKNIHSTELYCDATIACHGKYYPVHRMVLSTCSEYFEEIFKMTQCKHPFIIVNDIKSDELESLLNYMYKGEVNVLQECLPGLIKAAEALKVRGLAVPDEVSPHNEPKTPKEKKRNGNFIGSGSNPKRSRRSSETTFSEGENEEEFREINPRRIAKQRIAEESTHLVSNVSTPKNIDNRTTSNVSIEIEADLIKKEPFYTPEDNPETSTIIYLPDLGTESIHIKEEVATEELSSPLNPIISEGEGSNSEGISNVFSIKQPIIWDNNLGSENETENQSQVFDGMVLTTNTHLEMYDSAETTLLSAIAENSFAAAENSSATTSNAPDYKDPRACPYCPYRSKRTNDVKRHFRAKHTGEKPYSCPFCSYKSALKDSLKIHLRRHTREKYRLFPYKTSNSGRAEVPVKPSRNSNT